MEKANKDIRKELARNQIPMWKLGKSWGGKSEGTVIRRFRVEMSPEDKAEVRAVIEKLKKECDEE